MKEDLLTTGDKYGVVMCPNQALEDLKQLSLVLGFDKPVSISFAEGTGEAIDEDESNYEEYCEADGVETAISIVLFVMEVVSQAPID